MAIDETGLTKGLRRKLNALRKSVGDDLAEEVFAMGLWQAAAAALELEFYANSRHDRSIT